MSMTSLLTLPSGDRCNSSSTNRNPSAAHRETTALRIQVIDRLSELRSLRDEWDDLSRQASEANFSHESWFLTEAIAYFARDRSLRIVAVHEAATREHPARLVGLFPLEFQPRFGRWPIPNLRLLKHPYAFLGTPLIRAGLERAVWRKLLESLRSVEQRAWLIDLPTVAGDGPVHLALIDELSARNQAWTQLSRYHRAALRKTASVDDYLVGSMTNHQRQEMRRRSRRFSEAGAVRLDVVETVAELEDWVTGFLHLEAQGWKGAAAGAMACDQSRGDFLLRTVTDAFLRDQAELLTLRLDGRPVAMKCNFLCGTTGFAFKIAFDEELARFSPGVLLELETIRRAHENRRLAWMDSCAVPDHFMINRLWSERRPISRLLVSTGTRAGDLAVGALPFVASIRKACGPRPSAHT